MNNQNQTRRRVRTRRTREQDPDWQLGTPEGSRSPPRLQTPISYRTPERVPPPLRLQTPVRYRSPEQPLPSPLRFRLPVNYPQGSPPLNFVERGRQPIINEIQRQRPAPLQLPLQEPQLDAECDEQDDFISGEKIPQGKGIKISKDKACYDIETLLSWYNSSNNTYKNRSPLRNEYEPSEFEKIIQYNNSRRARGGKIRTRKTKKRNNKSKKYTKPKTKTNKLKK